MRILLALVLAAAGLIAWLLVTPRRDAGLVEVVSETAREEAEASPPPLASGLEELETASTESRAPEVAVSARAMALPEGPTCRIVGRVIDDTQFSVAGASVTLAEWALVPEIVATHETRTDADGRFALTCAVPSGPKQSLDVGAPPFHEKKVLWFGDLAASEGRALVAGDVDAGTLVLARCGVVEGRVLSSAGGPLEVGLMLQCQSKPGLLARSRADGSYSIGEVPVGHWLVTVQSTEWVLPGKTVVVVEPLRVTTAPDLVLAAAQTIQGVVVDTLGQPMAGILVSGRTSDTPAMVHAQSDAQGNFALTLLGDAGATLSVAADCEQRGFVGPGDDPRAAFAPGARGVRIVLERAPLMTFRVVEATGGAPIESFALGLQCGPKSNSFPRRPSLHVELQRHPHGEVTRRCIEKSNVIVEAPGYAPLEVEVRADAATPGVQTIALRRASSIKGRVLRSSESPAASPVPQVGARVFAKAMKSLKAPEKAERGANSSHEFDAIARDAVAVVTDANGAFTYGDLAPGSYALAVEAAGCARTTILDVSVPAESVVELGDIVLAREAQLRGVVRTLTGDSPVGMQILFDDGREVRIANEDGRFEVRGLWAGPRWLVWRRNKEFGAVESVGPRRLNFTLVAGETREIEIDATASGPCRLTVRVTRRGSPVADALLTLRAADDAQPKSWSRKFAKTNADGVATGSTVGGERVHVVVEDGQESVVGRSAAPLDLVAGTSVECVIEIKSGKLRVEFPAALMRPSEGRVGLDVQDDRLLSRMAFTPPTNGSAMRGWGFDWESDSVDFGSFPIGLHHIVLTIERFEREEEENNPKAGRWVRMREPIRTTVLIEDEKETRLSVP